MPCPYAVRSVRPLPRGLQRNNGSVSRRASAQLEPCFTYISLTHSTVDINDHYVRGTHRPHLVMDVHDSGAARGVAGAYQVRIDDAEPVVEGEQRAADLHVVRLFLQSRSGVRVVCPFCVLR